MRFPSTQRSPTRQIDGPAVSAVAESQANENTSPEDQPGEAALLAATIDRAGMRTPAALALRIVKPLSWMGGQLLWVAQPVLDSLGIGTRRGPLSVPGLARLFESDEGVDELIKQLEEGHGSQ